MRRELERIAQDLRLARRTLARSPGYLGVAVCTLALGIGATTALFTVVDAVLLKPLPFPDPDRLVMVWESPSSGQTNVVQTQNFVDWHARNRSFAGIAALHQLPMNVSGTGDAEQVQGLRVTGDFFSVLGVAPLVGRTIVPGEDVPGGGRSVVLSHAFWQQRYGGSATAIGQRLAVNGAPHEIVGVMPASFSFPGLRAELFVPLQIDPASAPREGRNFQTIARLRPGVSLSRAQADMEAVAAQTAVERPEMNARWSAIVVPLIDQAVGSVRRPLFVLFGAVVFVLLIACANVANLALMRATARAHEMTVRLALGAGRGRLVHQLVVEGVVVAALGGVLGLLLARAGIPAIVSLFPPTFPLPRAGEIAVDARVLAFTAGVTMSAALLFGISPGLRAGRFELAGALHAGGRSVAGTTRKLRAALVTAEVALAVVLVAGAGLMVRSLTRLYEVDPGFRPERVLTMRMILLPSKYANAARRAAFVDNMLDHVRAVPQVTNAASIHFLPLSGTASGTYYYRADRPTPPPGERFGGDVSIVSPDYFRTMGIARIAGRDFDRRDQITAPLVGIINQAASRALFPGEDAVGKHLRVWWGVRGRPMQDTPDFEIVGVVADVHHGGLHLKASPCLFLSQDQAPSLFAALVIRTAGDPLATTAAVKQQIKSVDADQGVLRIDTMERIVSDSLARPRLQAVLLAAFGVLALALACVGLYGVISYSVEQRRREMGVRLALGAAPASVVRLVFGEGLRLTAAGLIAGLLGALALTRYLESLLFEVRPTDPAVFAGVALTLLMTAAAACYLPARRATRLDPAIVLRDE